MYGFEIESWYLVTLYGEWKGLTKQVGFLIISKNTSLVLVGDKKSIHSYNLSAKVKENGSIAMLVIKKKTTAPLRFFMKKSIACILIKYNH